MKGTKLSTSTITAALQTSSEVQFRSSLHAGVTGETYQATSVTIASVSDQDWYISRTHGVYHIPARPKDEAYAVVLLTSRGDVIDLGDNRRFPFVITAREIANDLLQDLQDHGIFVCDGARPSPEELTSAIARRDGYYHRLIGEGDVMWARGHSYREISDMHRRAAIALGVEREWAYVPMKLSDCPACGEKVKTGVAVCKHCRAILDAEKAAKHGLGLSAVAGHRVDTNNASAARASKAGREVR
jgi:hypothetical protein